MKHFSLCLALLLASVMAVPANAQNRIGFLGGLSSAKTIENPASDGPGFNLGGGIRFNYLFVEARYALGLADITKDAEVEDLNRGFQIMAGISAPIGR